jgi:hypothetical protein
LQTLFTYSCTICFWQMGGSHSVFELSPGQPEYFTLLQHYMVFPMATAGHSSEHAHDTCPSWTFWFCQVTVENNIHTLIAVFTTEFFVAHNMLLRRWTFQDSK